MGLNLSWDYLSRWIFQTSATLDQVGVFTNDLRDAALLSDVIGGLDQRDEASYDWPRPAMYAGVTSDAPVKPSFCWFDMPYHDQCDQDVLQAMEQIVDMLGDQVDRLPVAPELATLPRFIKSSTIMKSRETLNR